MRIVTVSAVITAAGLILNGCASRSEDISAAYVSPIQYDNYTCDQIREETARVTSRAQHLAGEVDDNATGDAVAMGVGVVLFWPALFFIDGDGPEAQEYARLKGERTTLEQVAIRKNCSSTLTLEAAAEAEADAETSEED